MGCFNKTAFYSHLPITYGDDIVMFVCADSISRFCRRDCTPISIVGTGLTPIAPPFFGKYDDYGSIEDVVDDVNHQLFKEKFGMELPEFCDIMHDLSGVTIGDLKEHIAKYKDGSMEENEYHHETVEDSEKLLALYEKIFGRDIKKPTPRTREYAEELNRFDNELYEYAMKRYNNTCVVVIMEHKAIYDKMVEQGRKHYFDHWFGEEKITPEMAFDNTAEAIKSLTDLTDDYKGDNPMTFGVGLDSMYSIDKIADELGKDDSLESQKKLLEIMSLATRYLKMSNFFGIKVCLHDTVTNEDVDHILYNGLKGDITKYKDILCDYAYFLSTFRRTCTTFEVSPYHNQEVAYDQLIPIYEEMVSLFKQKRK